VVLKATWLVEADGARGLLVKAPGLHEPTIPPCADLVCVLASLDAVGRPLGTELEFVIMVIAVSCVKLLSAHNSTQHTSRKHKV
jgi:hypothetical protein